MTEQTVHQLYCTHCTYRTSLQHQRVEGDVADQSAGYGIRDGSIERSHAESCFKQIEPFMYYRLPGDLTMSQAHELNSDATGHWRRLVYSPNVGGARMVAHVSYRKVDTQGRPNSYFAHVLLDNTEADNHDGLRGWTARDAAKLWGSDNWTLSDDMNRSFELQDKALHRLDNFDKGNRTPVTDEALVAFLTKDGDVLRKLAESDQEPDISLIPERWYDTAPAARQKLLISTIDGFLQLDYAKSQTMLLAVEPCLAALLFYGVARLLPQTGIGKKLSFSTFESHQDRPRTTLAATTFHDPKRGELPADASLSRGFAINTFRSASLTSLPDPKWDYSRAIVERLVDSIRSDDESVQCTSNVAAVEQLIAACEKISDVDAQAMGDMLTANTLAAGVLEQAESTSFQTKFRQLRRNEARDFVRESAGRQLAGKHTPPAKDPFVNLNIKAPPPPPGQKAPSESVGAPSHVPLPTAPGSLPASVKPLQARAGNRQGFGDLVDAPDRCMAVLKLVGYQNETLPDKVEAAWKALLEELLAASPEKVEEYIDDPAAPTERALHAVRSFVSTQKTQKRLPDCSRLWNPSEQSENPCLASRFLGELAEKPPVPVDGVGNGVIAREIIQQLPGSKLDFDKIRIILKTLVKSDASPDHELLNWFVDHVSENNGDTFRDVLRAEDTDRKNVFKWYVGAKRKGDNDRNNAEQDDVQKVDGDPESAAVDFEFAEVREVPGDVKQTTDEVQQAPDEPREVTDLRSLIQKELDQIPQKLKRFSESVTLLEDAKNEGLLDDASMQRFDDWLRCRSKLKSIASTLKERPGGLAGFMGKTKEHDKRLDKLGEELAKYAHLAMPDGLWTSDKDGTKRQNVLAELAPLLWNALGYSEGLPEEFRDKLKRVFSGGSWNPKIALPPSATSQPQPFSVTSPTESIWSPSSTGTGTSSSSLRDKTKIIVVIAATLLVGSVGWWYVTTSSERAVRNLLAIENVAERVRTFLQLSSDEINTLARLNLGNDNYDKALLELMQQLSDKQLLKVRKSDERQALVTKAMAVAFERKVDPQEQLELLLKLPEKERLPALQNLRDLPVLRHLLVNGSDVGRDQLMMEMTAEERNALLGELDNDGLTALLVKLSVPMIDRIPPKQLQRMKVEDLVFVVSRQDSIEKRNALLAQCPAPTLNEVVGQLHKTFLTSLDSKVLGQVNDPALVKILRGFTGESLRQLLEQVDTKRRHALQDNVKAALADGEADDVKVLLALNIPTTPPPAKSTEVPPAPEPAKPGDPAAIATLIEEFSKGDEAKRMALLEKLPDVGGLNAFLEVLSSQKRSDLITLIPEEQVWELADRQLKPLVASASPEVATVLLKKLGPQRRVAIVFELPDDKLKPLAAHDNSLFTKPDLPHLMKNPKRFADLLAMVPDEKLKQLTFSKEQIGVLTKESSKLANLWKPKPVVVEDKALEGHSVTYIDLPPVPEKLADVEHAHELILAAPQPNVRELKIHGVDYLRYNGTTGVGPKVKATKFKPSKHQLIYDSGERGVDSFPLCTFRVEDNGEVRFKWECPEYPALQRAIEMVRCSVLEIERVGAENQFVSFLKPIQIPGPLKEHQAARETNTIFWLLPGQQKPLYFERWPLLVNGLVLHVPPEGKQYSPKEEDLRILTPRLETLQKVHNVGGTMLRQGSTVDTAAGGEFVPAIALVMQPREPNEAEKKEVEAVEERTNKLKRALTAAQSKKGGKNAVDGVFELAFLLNRRQPQKDGNKLGPETIEFRDWAFKLADAAKVEINDGSKENLKSISLPGINERDALFHSGITLTGDIYRVVGFSRAKTTPSKVEGGVIVKVLEIAAEKPPDKKK